MAKDNSKRTIQLLILFALLISFFFVLKLYYGGGEKPVVARVGRSTITRDDIRYRLSKLPPYYFEVARSDMSRFIDDVVKDELLYQEGLARGLQRDPDVQAIVKEAERKIVIARLIKDEIDDKISITNEEIEAYYEVHRDDFVAPGRLRASHILVNDEERAREVKAKLEGGADFGELAREYSQDTTGEQGGDIGYFTVGHLIPEFEQACRSLAVGEVSGIVKTSFGYHIIKVTERLAPQPLPLEQVQDQIREILWKQQKQERFQRLVDRLRQKKKVEIHEEVMK